MLPLIETSLGARPALVLSRTALAQARSFLVLIVDLIEGRGDKVRGGAPSHGKQGAHKQFEKAPGDKALAERPGRFSRARIQKRGFPSWVTWARLDPVCNFITGQYWIPVT